MQISKSTITNSLLFYGRFIPLKRNGLLFVVFGLLMAVFISREYYAEDSHFIPFLNVFAWLIGVFAALIVGLGLFYSLFCWVYLAVTSNRLRVDLKIGLEDGQKGVAGLVPITLSLSKVVMPLAGYLKTWLVFRDGTMVGPVLINKFSGGWKDLLAKEGEATLQLERRTQYHVKGYVFSFEDYLQFFQFSYFKKHAKTFYLYSQHKEVPSTDIPPSKAREEQEKVRTSKRVEGDHLNYKSFESGDDVRRIVWKIFAKNKELVVRIPEIINPYASHLRFVASFHNSLLPGESTYTGGMLDYYKDIIYNTCLQIEKSGRKLEFKLDQPVGEGLIVDRKDYLPYALSCAHWHGDPVQDHGALGDSSVVCVSSLVPAGDLEGLVQKRSVILFIVRVSRYLDEQNLFNWKNVILRNEQQSELNKLRWTLSRHRRLLKKNERKIAQLIDSHDFQGQLI